MGCKRRCHVTHSRAAFSCTSVSEDQYGRAIATYSVNGTDLGERFGLALEQYSKERHAAAERDADRSGRGMWAGSYVEPWLFRACIRAGGTPTNCSDDANAHP
ncbi:hypothetical protein [uncultured Bradyrhizobium sp.]|uniref:thermonuclease family protein n=1 Tax=Bradyrhizobium sp. TaxID=376 RepID=UPI002608442E|nr:hypothetical protein [uncultured Bradyrhizobium sp.]